MKKFHVSEDGVARICNAKSVETCRAAQIELSDHFESKEAAQKAYENFQENRMTSFSLQKKKKKRLTSEDLYAFIQTTDEYGINYRGIDHDDVYEDADSKGSVWYRSDSFDPVFDDFDEDDVQTGYKMNVPLNTLQKYVSSELIEEYISKDTLVSFNQYLDPDEPISIIRIIVHKNKLFVLDGNHRMIASKISNKNTFDGIVFEMDDDLEDARIVSPSEFNSRF